MASKVGVHPEMPNRFREWVESLLPWFDRQVERRRDAHTAAIVRLSESNRSRGERVIDEYRQASKAEDAAAERVIDEVRRDKG